jgi:type IV secretion system protein VirB6
MACSGLQPGGDFLSGALRHIDCQALAIGESGYRVLASSGSSAGLILTSALTIFVALFGYRMLLGQTPTARDGIVAVVKVGFVLALATSWPAYRTVVYDVTMRGPAELASQIGGGAELPGSGGGLVPWLQSIDYSLLQIAELGTGNPDAQQPVQTTAPGADAAVPVAVPITPLVTTWDTIDAQEQVGKARTVYLAATIGAFAVVRLIGGLLLALGPLFMIFLLFRGTYGLFEGWVRALVGVLLGAVATATILGVQMALLSPWLNDIVATRQANEATPGVALEIYVGMLVFALTLAAALFVAARVGYGFRIPAALFGSSWTAGERRGADAISPPPNSPPATADSARPERAQMIAAALQNTQRREQTQPLPGANLVERGGSNPNTPARASVDNAVTPIGRNFQRRTQPRVSALATKRDLPV